MLINFHISLITKRFLWSFDRHSDKTVTLSELLHDINNFSKVIVDVISKSHEFSCKIVRVITIVVSNPVNFLVNALLWRQSIDIWYSMTSRFCAILLLSPPSYILYILGIFIHNLYRLHLNPEIILLCFFAITQSNRKGANSEVDHYGETPCRPNWKGKPPRENSPKGQVWEYETSVRIKSSATLVQFPATLLINSERTMNNRHPIIKAQWHI